MRETFQELVFTGSAPPTGSTAAAPGRLLCGGQGSCRPCWFGRPQRTLSPLGRGAGQSSSARGLASTAAIKNPSVSLCHYGVQAVV